MKFLDNRIPPPLLFAAIAASMVAAAQTLPVMDLDPFWRFGMAGAFFFLSAACAIPAFLAFGRAKTTINPVNIEAASSLVTGGIYRLTRNPMYVALASLLVCLAVYLAVPWVFLGPLAFVLFITRFQIVPEERMLRAKFGDRYFTYERKVRRWL